MTPLRQRMTEGMQVRSLSPRTQATYILQVSLFARRPSESARQGTAPTVIDDSRVYTPWPPPETGGEIVRDASPPGNPRAGDQNGSIRLPLNLRCKSEISLTGASYFVTLAHCAARPE
jgi:hypothetical protein